MRRGCFAVAPEQLDDPFVIVYEPPAGDGELGFFDRDGFGFFGDFKGHDIIPPDRFLRG